MDLSETFQIQTVAQDDVENSGDFCGPDIPGAGDFSNDIILKLEGTSVLRQTHRPSKRKAVLFCFLRCINQTPITDP